MSLNATRLRREPRTKRRLTQNFSLTLGRSANLRPWPIRQLATWATLVEFVWHFARFSTWLLFVMGFSNSANFLTNSSYDSTWSFFSFGHSVTWPLLRHILGHLKDEFHHFCTWPLFSLGHWLHLAIYSLGRWLHLAIYSLGHLKDKFHLASLCTWPTFDV